MAARKPTQYQILIDARNGSLVRSGEVEAFNPEQARGRARKLDTVVQQIRKLGGRGDLFVVPQTSMIPSHVEVTTAVKKGDSNG